MIDKKHLENFIAEVEDILKLLHDKIALLEIRASDNSAVDDIFRAMHTIKGNASFFDFAGVRSVAHCLEDLLAAAKSRLAEVNKSFITFLWEGTGLISSDLDMLKAGRMPSVITPAENEFITRVKERIAQCDVTRQLLGARLRATDTVRYMCEKTDVSKFIFIVESYLTRAAQGVQSSDVTEKFLATLKSLSEVLALNSKKEAAALPLKMISDYEMMIGDNGVLEPFLLGVLNDLFGKVLASLNRIEITSEPSADTQLTPILDKICPVLRIEETHIDAVVTLVRQLDGAKVAFAQVRDKMMAAGVEASVLLDFQKAVNNVNFLTRDIMQALVKVKVTSPKELLEKLESLTQALAQSYNKKVTIKTEGKYLLMDRRKIDVLERILIHVVRNSIAHGIEQEDERLRLGKPREGLISIELVDENRDLKIIIADDGRGFDLAAIREEAYKAGKITREEKDMMDEQKLVELLFSKGVSTYAGGSELAGRGVGMAAVFSNAKSIGGSIEVHTKSGEGTRFILRLPHDFKF